MLDPSLNVSKIKTILNDLCNKTVVLSSFLCQGLIMKCFFLSVLLLAGASLFAQNATLSGYVRDADNGEELIGANIYFPSLQKGAVTNEYGYYSISVPQNAYEVKFLFIGYAVFEKEIDLRSDVRLDVELRPESVELMEVVLTDDRSVENVQSIEMSVTDLSIKEVKKNTRTSG